MINRRMGLQVSGLRQLEAEYPLNSSASKTIQLVTEYKNIVYYVTHMPISRQLYQSKLGRLRDIIAELNGRDGQITWKRQTKGYANGYNGYYRKWPIFSISWNASRSKSEEDDQWKLSSSLPGIGSLSCGDVHASVKDAQIRAQKILIYWIKNTKEVI